jgi:hypothetical protein
MEMTYFNRATGKVLLASLPGGHCLAATPSLRSGPAE